MDAFYFFVLLNIILNVFNIEIEIGFKCIIKVLKYD